MAKIRFDRRNCEGFFVCSTGDPDDFEEIRDEKKVNLVGGGQAGTDVWEKQIPGEGSQFEAAKTAAAGCPVDVIQVFDDDGTLVEGPEKLPIEEGKGPAEKPAPKPEAPETPA